MYQGQLVSNISKTSALGTKPQNLLLKTVSLKNDANKYAIDTLKLMVRYNFEQFTTKEGADEFKEQLSKLLTKEPKETKETKETKE